MRPQRALTLLSIVTFAAACTTGAASPSAAPAAVATLVATSVPQATSTPASSPEATTGGPGGSAAPTSIDPCTLLTQAEASTAVGVHLGTGVTTEVSPDRICTWKLGTTEVKLILAPPAPDAGTAQAYWDATTTQVPKGVTFATVPGFDRAAYGTGAVSGFSVSALFVIKGAQFFDFYCGLQACTEPASVTAANLIVGRLP